MRVVGAVRPLAAIAAAVWLCGAAAQARDACVDSALGTARFAFPRVGLDAPPLPGAGPPEIKLGPTLGGGYLSIDDAIRECDLTVNVSADAGEPNHLFLQLAAEVSATVLRVKADEVGPLIDRCLASRPRKYDEWNSRDSVRQHARGISVECGSSLLLDRTQTTTLTVYLRDDDKFYEPSGLDGASDCLATVSQRLRKWIAGRPDLTFDDASIDNRFASLRIAPFGVTPELLVRASCAGDAQAWTTNADISAQLLSTILDGLGQALGRSVTAPEQKAAVACLASRPVKYDLNGDRWGKSATVDGHGVTCRFTRETDSNDFEVELAIGAP